MSKDLEYLKQARENVVDLFLVNNNHLVNFKVYKVLDLLDEIKEIINNDKVQ